MYKRLPHKTSDPKEKSVLSGTGERALHGNYIIFAVIFVELLQCSRFTPHPLFHRASPIPSGIQPRITLETDIQLK